MCVSISFLCVMLKSNERSKVYKSQSRYCSDSPAIGKCVVEIQLEFAESLVESLNGSLKTLSLRII